MLKEKKLKIEIEIFDKILRIIAIWFFMILLSIGSLILLIGLGSAQSQDFGTFDRFRSVELKQSCDCSFVNITSISFEGKNATNLNLPVSFQKTANGQFNYTIPYSFRNIGTYTVNGLGDPNGVKTPFSATFTIDNGGLFTLDFKDKLTIGILLLIGISGIIFCFTKMRFIGGVILLILGLLMLFNNFNFIISIGLILLGITFSLK